MKSPLWLLAAPCAIPVAFYVITGHIWIALGIAALIVTAASLAAAFHFSSQNIDLRADLADADNRMAALEAAAMEARLTDPATATTVLVPLLRPEHPRLRSIPTQRDGSHDDVPPADESWLDEITEGRWTW